MLYLSLFTLGIFHYVNGDWDAAITYFGDALTQTSEPISSLDRGFIHFYRASAYYRKGQTDDAIDDYGQLIKQLPDLRGGWSNFPVIE